MSYAYNENYLDDAMRNLGEALDYATNDCGMSADEFMKMFIDGGIAEQFGSGNPKYVAGMSGVELVWEVVASSKQKRDLPEARVEYARSPEYWAGWILAYYQWVTGKRFQDILQSLSMEEILRMYPTLHEASEQKFVDAVNRRLHYECADVEA